MASVGCVSRIVERNIYLMRFNCVAERLNRMVVRDGGVALLKPIIQCAT